MTDAERAALERLIKIAQGNTGQSRRGADFLLAWWNAASCALQSLRAGRVHDECNALPLRPQDRMPRSPGRRRHGGLFVSVVDPASVLEMIQSLRSIQRRKTSQQSPACWMN
jgi:hypothetical protein